METSALIKKLKSRLYDKLHDEPFEKEDGTYYDPLPAKDIAAIGSLILRIAEFEEKRKDKEREKAGDIIPIPAIPFNG